MAWYGYLFKNLDMKYLNLTTSTNPTNPGDGNPYVYYNDNIGKAWIFMGIRWILSNGSWVMSKSWDDSGRWNFYGPPV